MAPNNATVARTPVVLTTAPPGSYFSDLAFSPGPSRLSLLTTVVTRTDNQQSVCRVASVSRHTGALVHVTPRLEHVHEACWLRDGVRHRVLVASQGLPVGLYCAGEGVHGQSRGLLASYAALDAYSGEVEPLYSVATDDVWIYAGSRDAVYRWDASRPGKDAVGMYPRWDDGYRESSLSGCIGRVGRVDRVDRAGRAGRVGARRRRKHDIVSSVAVGAGSNSSLVALGGYCGRVAMFDSRTNAQCMYVDGFAAGVTQVGMAGGCLYVGCRGQGDVWVFDMRKGSEVVGSGVVKRGFVGETRRVRFGVGPRGLASGVGAGVGGGVRVWERVGTVWEAEGEGGEEQQGVLVNACAWCMSDGALATATGDWHGLGASSCIKVYENGV